MPASPVTRITVRWPELANEHGTPMLWLGCWLVGAGGAEGAWFHSGRGGGETAHDVPPDTAGIRVRRWMSEGLAPEYADLAPVPARVDVASLPFDEEQPFSQLEARLAASRAAGAGT